jgi:amino-acid N-acetyltransferase
MDVASIRKAELGDIPALQEMINYYAARQIMLPRTLTDLYECVREFLVAEEERRIAGCGALKFYNQELGEIRSLCVAPGAQSCGLGRALTAQLLHQAEEFGLKTVFALTVAPDFFFKCGFRESVRERFPMKVWRDCLRCDRYSRCKEKTVSIDLPARAARAADSSPATAEVSA